MADPIRALQSGSIALRGGGLVYARGNCCCGGGGPTPCACTSAPGCLPAGGVQSLYLVKTSPWAPATYLYGPRVVDCCCNPNSPGTFSVESREQAFNQAGCLIAEGSYSGSASTPGTVRVPFLCRSGPCQNLSTTSAGTSEFDGSGCSPAFPYIPAGWCAGFGAFGFGNGVSGWHRQTCDVNEGAAAIYAPDGLGGFFVAARVSWRFVRVTDRTPCLSTSCVPCCLPAGTCFPAEAGECAAFGGVVLDDCAECERRRSGACCKPDGTCEVTSRPACTVLGGLYLGDLTTCAGAQCPPPPTWACCLGTACVPRTQAQCALQGGQWFQGVNCTPTLCLPQVGACCYPDGSCGENQTSSFCAANGGTFRGIGTTCAQTGCTGACCWYDQGGTLGCTNQHTEAECMQQAIQGFPPPVWHGYGSCCTPQAFCANVINCSGGRAGPIRIATGAETLAVTGGCSGCGGTGNRGMTL